MHFSILLKWSQGQSTSTFPEDLLGVTEQILWWNLTISFWSSLILLCSFAWEVTTSMNKLENCVFPQDPLFQATCGTSAKVLPKTRWNVHKDVGHRLHLQVLLPRWNPKMWVQKRWSVVLRKDLINNYSETDGFVLETKKRIEHLESVFTAPFHRWSSSTLPLAGCLARCFEKKRILGNDVEQTFLERLPTDVLTQCPSPPKV